jgi:hypothetical protein
LQVWFTTAQTVWDKYHQTLHLLFFIFLGSVIFSRTTNPHTDMGLEEGVNSTQVCCLAGFGEWFGLVGLVDWVVWCLVSCLLVRCCFVLVCWFGCVVYFFCFFFVVFRYTCRLTMNPLSEPKPQTNSPIPSKGQTKRESGT